MADFKYRAFISYSHVDKKWADWLHKALEQYRVPKRLVGTSSRNGPVPSRLFPIYRDRAEFSAAADLSEHIRIALHQSSHLIVICSPHSAKSVWVRNEILEFKRLGRENNILAVIVDGEPHAEGKPGIPVDQECFPPELVHRLGTDGQLSGERVEPAAADARPQGDGREASKLKLVSGLLGVDYDTLKQRDLEAARRRTRLYGAIAAGMAVLAVVAVAGGILAYYYALQSQAATKLAVIQASTAEHTTDFMVSLFSLADPEQNRGKTITARELLDRGVIQINGELSGEHAVRANLLRAMGQAYSGLGFYPKADALLKNALLAARAGGSQRDILNAQLALAENSYIKSDYANAEHQFTDALNLARSLYSEPHAKTTEALVGLADSLSSLDRAADAERLYREALADDLKEHGERNVDTARSENSLGTQLYFEMHYGEAEALFRRALATRIALLGRNHADVARSMSNLGTLLYDTGRYREAETTWLKALPIFESVFGKSHPEVANILNNVGRAQLMRGDVVAAKATFDQVLAMDRQYRAKDDDDLILPLNSLAMIAMANRDYAAADAYLAEALAIARQKHHWMLNQVLGNLADLQVRTGQSASAEQTLAQARSALSAQYGSALQGPEAWRASVLDLVDGSLDIARNNPRSAEAKLLAALKVLSVRFGNSGFFVSRAEYLLAQDYDALGMRTKANKYRQMLALHSR
ncbi:MAG TPA: toll/interleukin-1 receptor domain-containing protein [Rhizomicrobium sp.]|jgi:tetratricopeptide (TPR) repeat protein